MGKLPHAPSRVPTFNSIQEEAEFWDTHDSTEFEDHWEPVEIEGPLVVTSEFFLEVEFDKATWERLRNFAQPRGLSRSVLAREWYMAGFERALAEAGEPPLDATESNAPEAG